MTDNKDFVMVPREATALLPCPFCGSDSVSVYPRTCDKKTPYNPLDRAFPMVRCGKCYAEVPGENWKGEDTAIEAWNRRAMLQSAPAAEVRRWPFVETPGQFTDRLRNAMVEFDLDLLAAVRNVLIENPPTLASVVAAPPAQVTDAQIEAIWMSSGPWSNDEIDHIAFARAVLAAQAGSGDKT